MAEEQAPMNSLSEIKTEEDNYMSEEKLSATTSAISRAHGSGDNNNQRPTDTMRGIAKHESAGRLSTNQFEPGDLIHGRYQIVRVIGSGGFGVVYEALDTAVHNQRIAIKTLKHNIADYELAAQRFEREIDLCCSIRSGHVVKILDSGMADDETLFYVMEYLEGQTLEDLLSSHEKFSFSEVKNILLQILEAIGEAHFKNIIHRDLKPANIWLCQQSAEPRDFYAKVLDFGIAKSLDNNSGQKLTQTGAWMGSPAYMSPEHLAGVKDLTPAADIFSIGLIALEMLTGYPAVEGDTPMEVALTISSPEELFIDDWILDSSLGNIIERCVRKNPADRFQNGDELADALKALDTNSLKTEYATAKMRKHAGRRSTMLSTSRAGSINTQIGLSPELQKANRERNIQMAIVGAIILCLFALGIFFVVRIYTNNNFAKPLTEEQIQEFQNNRDKQIQELVALGVKQETTKRILSMRMGTGMKQGAVWGGFCNDQCISRHADIAMQAHGKPTNTDTPKTNTPPAPAAPPVIAADPTPDPTKTATPQADSNSDKTAADKTKTAADKTKTPTDKTKTTKTDTGSKSNTKKTEPDDIKIPKTNSGSASGKSSKTNSNKTKTNSKNNKNTATQSWKVGDF